MLILKCKDFIDAISRIYSASEFKSPSRIQSHELQVEDAEGFCFCDDLFDILQDELKSSTASTSDSNSDSDAAARAPIIFAMDEIAMLTAEPPEGRRNGFFVLSHVLNVLREQPLAFVTMATESHINVLAPSPRRHASGRVYRGTFKLLLPGLFHGMPFDVFAKDAVKKGFHLGDVTKTSFMALFGRPL
jgi:hypothetical protein